MTTISATSSQPSAKAGRARLIVEVHVARRELERAGRLDEPGYREMLRAASNGRHDSAKNMSYPDLKAAMVLFEKAGFVKRVKAPSNRPLASAPEDRKVRALWLFLHVLGEVRDPSEQALAAYVKRIAKVDDLRWARGMRRDLVNPRYRTDLLIETLKKWAMRRLPAAVKALLQEVVAAHHAAPLAPDQVKLAKEAQAYLYRGQGFDMHWLAWECLMEALQRPVLADLAALPARETYGEE